ncbi:sigma-54-dependent Fis family transcriptional regulator [Kordiimonas sediminis]|uniref:Sigma-54-dependent Fis family transcriptional regulator n=1 Tax=Kordiimonas sediminis TaxID=1735581 RepID=A0A919AME3_9PROT|nr:sigma-54 dependent transcriptional regulator [Kordiimonas sediminis]GHF15894.1 sigma-54-dependent Fis family transcriptional regulator [Kordiimonas sediminis]
MQDKALPDTRILVIEDSPTLALTYKAYLQPLGFPVDVAETGKEALAAIQNTPPTAILLDLKLPDMDGLDILRTLNEQNNKAQVIVITAHGSVSTAVEAMRDGAADFLLKPFSAERLNTTVSNALEIYRLSTLVEKYESRKERDFGNFIGSSSAMQAVYRMIEDAAPSKASVFIMGESGTGKELCAQAIHDSSQRSGQSFVAINCAAIPANLMESEIFGHVKGAFTGALTDRQGAAQKANNGTLFLDEICEMPLDLQAKLLRFIQTGQIVKVGSNEPINVNVRFVCATNRNPWVEVEEGRFREDLFYRLHVIPIYMPPLRDRQNDILLIAQEMLKKFSEEEGKSFEELGQDAKDRLMGHTWPGNVRELSNVIQSAVVLNDSTVLEAGMLDVLLGRSQRRVPKSMSPTAPTPGHAAPPPAPEYHTSPTYSSPSTPDDIQPLHIAERQIIEAAIQACGGKVIEAAGKLGVNPSTLYRKIKSWEQEDSAAQ